MAGEDFVHVRLSADGERMAGAGKQVRIVRGRGHFLFKVGEAQRVTRAYEWNVLLRHDRFEGRPVFELADTTDEEK